MVFLADSCGAQIRILNEQTAINWIYDMKISDFEKQFKFVYVRKFIISISKTDYYSTQHMHTCIDIVYGFGNGWSSIDN